MKNFNDYPEFLSSKQMLDLTGWSKSTLWRYTGPGGKLSHIKITVLGKNKPPLYDKNKLRSYLTNGDREGQFRYEILSVHNLGRYNSNLNEPFSNGNGGGDHGQSL